MYFPSAVQSFKGANAAAARVVRNTHFTAVPGIQAWATFPLLGGSLRLTLPAGRVSGSSFTGVPATIRTGGAAGNALSVLVTFTGIPVVKYSVDAARITLSMRASSTVGDIKALWEAAGIGGVGSYAGGANGSGAFTDPGVALKCSGGVDGDDKLAEFGPYRSDQYRAILLKPAGAAEIIETYLPGNEAAVYSATNWVVRGSASVVTDRQIDARVESASRATNPSGEYAASRMPAVLMRTGAFTGARIKALLEALAGDERLSGAAVIPHPQPLTVYVGLSDDNVPEASELTIPAVNGSVTIAAFTAKYVIVARLASESDLTEIYSQVGGFNTIGSFDQHGSMVTRGGLNYKVLISDSLHTFGASRTWRFR